MPEYVIEKSIPRLGEMSPFQRDQTVRRSCSPLHGIARDVEWVQSYLTQNKCYCVYRAPREEVLWDLIEQWELPKPLNISQVSEVGNPEAER